MIDRIKECGHDFPVFHFDDERMRNRAHLQGTTSRHTDIPTSDLVRAKRVAIPDDRRHDDGRDEKYADENQAQRLQFFHINLLLSLCH